MRDDQPGDRLDGRYELIAISATGGMATVWRAKALGASGFQRKVAVKRMKREIAKNAEFAALFVEEARVVADLQHPNIAQVFDFGQDSDGRYYIVMEWIEGLDLEDWIKAHQDAKRLSPWTLVCAIGIEILRALEAAHDRRDEQGRPQPVIHRDVNPANILLASSGVIKLADFGLARAMDRASMTQPGMVKGKMSYLAPELLLTATATSLTDIYGVGITMWEALAARPMFQGVGVGDMVARIRDGKIVPLDSVRPDLPRPVVDLVHMAMAKDPERRFSSATAMISALKTLLRSQPETTDARAIAQSVVSARRTLSVTPPPPAR